MDKKTASKLARGAIKVANAKGKVKYQTRESLSFDFIVNFLKEKYQYLKVGLIKKMKFNIRNSNKKT